MIRHSALACLVASLGLSLACERGSHVEAETRDLAEAQNNTGNVAKDLEAQLQKAKADVIELEKKLALAREGVTDEVLQERSELQGALESQRREVQEEVNEARREAQVLNKDMDKAMQQLKQTQPPAQVDARLNTETSVVRGTQQAVESPPRNELVPVRGGPELQPTQGAAEVKSTTSTTHAAPTQPTAPGEAVPDHVPPTVPPQPGAEAPAGEVD